MEEKYIGTTERAAIIRAELKAKKWTARDISVRASSFSMGSSITVTIKNADIPIAAVKEIADKHESISRCQLTGDILSGGNRYLHVGYSTEAREVFAARLLPSVQAAAEELAKASDNVLMPVTGSDFKLGKGRHGHGFSLWRYSGHEAEVYDAREAAIVIGMGGR